MNASRRNFLKYCAGSAAAFGMQFPTLGRLKRVFAAGVGPPAPSYPISSNVYTTLEKTIIPTAPPAPYPGTMLRPVQISQYAANGYGVWGKDENGNPNGSGVAYVRPDMQTGQIGQSNADPSATTLLSFFTMSDIHITDKECSAQVLALGYHYPEPYTVDGVSAGNSSCYSGTVLYTTHVLDAAVQTINALHKQESFDFGISLGDAVNNNQYNELRWYIDVLDGKLITPSSGAHIGADGILYQKPYQAAGLDKSIKWYQAIGNHDQFWLGSTLQTDYTRSTHIGSDVLNIDPINYSPPNWSQILGNRGYYMGVVDGSTEFGDVIYAGPESHYATPPRIAADSSRRALSTGEWMSEFLNSTSRPVGHGFTQQMINNEFACYHFYPRADIPIKVIVLDDIDKSGSAYAALDQSRYEWLVSELEDGQNAGELMIICAHIPINPYAQMPMQSPAKYMNIWAPSAAVTQQNLLDTLHSYPNLLMWIAGHVHRNTITPQPSSDGDLTKGFWMVETPSLRDFPQQFRRFKIVRNSDNSISTFVLSVDPAANPATLADGSSSPALMSRSCGIATQEIFGCYSASVKKNYSNLDIAQGAGMDNSSGVYNAELVNQLTPAMQDKIGKLKPRRQNR